MLYDLIVIGGGAAGFFGAIIHAENGGGPTLILEKTKNLLGKVKISGGGRCNVTHHCFDPRELSKYYPRGEKSLIGALHRFSAEDTVKWFESKGVALKVEADGRMFPITDDSQTVIDCLTDSATDAGVEIRKQCGVKSIRKEGDVFKLISDGGEELECRNVLLATGGTRLAAGAKLAEELGHSLEPAVPSLFTFKIDDSRIASIPGLSVAHTELSISGSKLKSSGPLLVTHWGVSGPGVLRISAWGARELAVKDYTFTLRVNWLPDLDVAKRLQEIRNESGRRRLHSRSYFSELPKRLWVSLVEASNIPDQHTWSQMTKEQSRTLLNQLTVCDFLVQGKSLNKDEFVTCGGVKLKEINLKTMESKLVSGLYFAGEVMDVDGITGGFNFQNAWTSGYHAGISIAGGFEI